VTTHCFAPLLGKRLRVTELDSCGVVLPNALRLSTDGFITLSLSSEVEDGAEIIVKKASGALCVNERQASSFKRFNVEIEFCGVNPSLLAMVTNAEEYMDYAGDAAGFTIGEGELKKWFALELWMGMSGQVCAPGTEEASAYMVLPFVVGGVPGDITVDGENAVTFSLSGAVTRGGNGWGVGPYDVLMDSTLGAPAPAPLPTALDPFDHLLLIDTALAPPPESCDPIPVTPVPIATGATAGTPGAFTPAGSTPPPDLAALQASAIVADPTTAWTTGQSVVLGDASDAHWDGAAWVGTLAP
jgi:hypothetical protein